jgi:sugar/nucleoside kinase (ribokinase family)
VSLLVTGSIAIDTVKTPYGISENCLGGSATYFSVAASFFSPVRLVGVIGSDCPFDLSEVFRGRNIDLAGLEIRRQSKTFRWAGSYPNNMNDRTTDYIELNVLAEAPPKIPDSFRDSKFVFLANTAPRLQHELLEQIDAPTFVAADTMNIWIQDCTDDLLALLKRIDCLIINDDEARMLADRHDLTKAAEQTVTMGVNVVVVKKGESGSIMCDAEGRKFMLPAYPAAEVKDPTGAGDSFAGGLMGYLAQSRKTDFPTLKTAIAYGTVVASFAVEDFSLNGLTSVDRNDIENRFKTLRELTHF